MAGLDLEEKLSCAICLELFTEPVTTPCGHSFCLRCLRDHLGRQRLPDCPACRTAFGRPPEQLAKNLVLAELVKVVRLSGGQLPRAPAPPPGCPDHHRPLDLYCRRDGCRLCSACSVGGHRDHEVVSVEDERAQRQKELVAKHEEVERQEKKTELLIDTLKQQSKSIKDSAFRAQTSYVNKFDTLAKELEEVKAKVIEYIATKEHSSLEQVDSTVEKLEEKRAELRKARLKLETTLKSNDTSEILQFPQEIQVLKRSPQDQEKPIPELGIEDQLEAMKQHLEEISLLVCKSLQGFVRQAPESKKVPESTGNSYCVPVKPPEPRALPSTSHLKEPFLQNYRQLRFNPNTAHRYLTLSKDGCKVSHRAAQKYPVHEERFEREWQVLCCESFETGQHYWEVQINKQWVYLGVTYSAIDRKGPASLIGRNGLSWSLQLFSKSYSAWHSDRETKLTPGEYHRVGVYLDCTAGTLSFYGITDTITPIHTFHTVFTQPLYPAVWVGENVTATLCQLQ
ncbi:tripartite motif-containing protein 65-like [Pristis pectinata]|uniref:tripartite motif-containing protein 65-like n=1 Tax=Pristis pectinata TaxID=685728 RepID=UPI00223E54D9|nr:tripartite motif-containing protein 65-like [Pristis pectinata]